MENNSTIALEQTEAIEKITQSTNYAIEKISQTTTEAINTLTPATNEAIAKAVNEAIEKISLASIETVSKLSHAPTQTWWEKSLEPELFWIAFTGLATFGAVTVALLTPFFEKRNKIKVCTNLIEEELKGNYKLILLMKNNSENPKQFTAPLTADLMNINIMSALKLVMWNQYRFQLASQSPKLHARYNSINSLIQTYSKKPSDNINIPESIKSTENYIKLTQEIEEMKEKADKMLRDIGISEIYKAYQTLEYLTKDTK